MPSTNHLGVFVLALFVAGAILFVVGTMMRREREVPETVLETAAPPPALAAADDVRTEPEPEISLELRIDMVERLAIVGEPWCVEELERIRRDDPDEMVRDAADNALLVIASRPVSS